MNQGLEKRQTSYWGAEGPEASLKAAGAFKVDVVWLSEGMEDGACRLQPHVMQLPLRGPGWALRVDP